MHTLARILILCVLCIGYIYGQESYGTYNRDTDIFIEYRDTEYTAGIKKQSVEGLCNLYYIFLNNQRINCNQIKFIQRSLIDENNIQRQEVEGNIKKREIDDTELEGSGHENEEKEPGQPLSSLHVSPPNTQYEDESEHNDEIRFSEEKSDTEISTVTAIKGNLTETIKLSVTDDITKDLQTANDDIIVPVLNFDTAGKEKKSENEDENTQNTIDQDQVDSPTASPVENVELKKVMDNVSNQESIGTVVDTVVQKDEDILTDTPKEEPNKVENVHKYRSGNIITESIIETAMERHEQNSMATNAEIKKLSSNEEGEEPKSGESAKEADEGRKDTKVLIILFVAVVVVGAAAFAYNFIKKRKQKELHAFRERNTDGIVPKRSLQSLTPQTGKLDLEQGTEMKPLMTEKKLSIPEYKDEKESMN